MTRQLTTLHEHFRADPRGADSFGRWIEDRIWELLQRPSNVEVFDGAGTWVVVNGHREPITLADAMLDAPFAACAYGNARVIVLDGTVIKEWSGNNSV